MNFETYYQARAQRIEHFLDRILPTQGGQTALDEPTRHLMPTPEPRIDPGARQLYAAMRYSVLGGGKRLRPLLVYATGEALGAPLEYLDAAAAAVELIHCYSLIHDDLPAMDNDTLRRGKATCHIAFDEATAILAGE